MLASAVMNERDVRKGFDRIPYEMVSGDFTCEWCRSPDDCVVRFGEGLLVISLIRRLVKYDGSNLSLLFFWHTEVVYVGRGPVTPVHRQPKGSCNRWRRLLLRLFLPAQPFSPMRGGENKRTYIEQTFAIDRDVPYAVFRTICTPICSYLRVKFDQWMRALDKNKVMPEVEEGETIFEYFVNLGTFEWEK